MYILFAYIQSIFICVFDILMFIVMIIYIHSVVCGGGRKNAYRYHLLYGWNQKILSACYQFEGLEGMPLGFVRFIIYSNLNTIDLLSITICFSL